MTLRAALALGLALTLAPSAARAAPVISFTAPSEADEGQELTIRVSVTDSAGATSWSWDLDGDGSYGELAGEATYVVPAGATDGPSEVRVAVEARGPTETRTAEHVVMIRNVAPAFRSEPPRTAAVRQEYRYDVTFREPAGDLDPVEVLLTSRPPGMIIEGTRITWVPEPAQRGRSFPAILRAADDDGGESAQMWEIAVDANAPPSAPVPMSPVGRARVPEGEPVTLTVENAEDRDEDPLLYSFRLSRTSTFEGPDVVGSGEVEQGVGTTSWTTREPLGRGLWYWQAWATDGMEESPRAFAQLVVGEATGASLPDGAVIPAPDAGPGGGRGRGGCAASGAPTAGAPVGLLLVLGGLLRRRRVS